MKNKKIAIIRTDSKTIDLNSYNCQEIGLAKGLSKVGIDSDVIMAGNTHHVEVLDKIIPTGGNIRIRTIPFRMHPLFASAVFPTIKDTLLSEGYDLVHVNEVNEITTCQVAKIALQNNIKLIVYQGMYKDLLGRKNQLKQLYFKIFCYPLIRRATKSIATKTSRAQKYLQTKGFMNTAIFPVGLDQTKFTHDEHFNLRESLSIPDNQKILSYVGVFEKRRNLDFLLSLAESLQAENYSLILAGDGEDVIRIKQQASAKNLTNVYFPGKIPQDKVSSIYLESDLFLLASDYEIYGMVVLESLYFGCPVFSTKTAGPEDLIEPYVNGCLFDDLDINKWKNSIVQYIDSFDRVKIKEHLRDNFIWDELAKRYKRQFLEN